MLVDNVCRELCSLPSRRIRNGPGRAFANRLGLRLTKDAFNAALNGSSLEDTNRMEGRNQAFVIANAITEGAKELG